MITRLKLKGLYMYAGGFYTYSIFALVFWETRRSDFGVSMGHHVATAILIILSYIFRFDSNVLVVVIISVLLPRNLHRSKYVEQWESLVLLNIRL